MSESTIKVNEYTGDEKGRIDNETSKPVEPEGYCASPSQVKIAIHRTVSLANALALCQHVKQNHAGALTWCTTCGAVRRPLPTPKLGVPIADGEWERPMWVEELRKVIV